ncbi:MAG: LPS assembly protein LptD [Phycisphaerales bacterium JB061]
MHACTRSIPALLLACGLAAPSFAQSDRFADIELPIEPVAGEIALSGLRAWTWTDDSGPVPVHRVVLDDDVRVYLAGYEMAAETAVLWLSPRPELGPDVVQVFAHLTEVSTPEADATVALASDVLSIQGVIRLTMPVDLAADEIEPGPIDLPSTLVAEVALSGFLDTVETSPIITPTPLDQLAEDRPGTPIRRIAPEMDFTDALPRATAGSPIMTARGIVSLAAGRVIRTITDEEQAVVLEDGVNVTYREPGTDRVLELSAQRAVVFFATDVGPNTTSVRASNIDGIYMEGDVVASDGRYNLRGPRVFYDVRNDRALILDAVFSTFDTRVGFPLYVRARSVRQLSEDEFVADRASVSNTAFARPNLTIGARSVTIRQENRTLADGSDDPYLVADAKNITLNGLGVPIGWLPAYEGNPEEIPLRDVRFVTSSKSGEEIRTRWDLFPLLGIDEPEQLSANLLLDALFDRGPGVGLTSDWQGDDFKGSLLTYWVINDTGTDVLTSGAKVERDGENRGIIRAEHIAKVGGDWTVFAEASHVSDENFVDAFYENLAQTGREFKTGVHARKLTENSSLTLEASTNFDDFTPNEYILQSDGYTVERLPEATYSIVATDLFAQSAPGLMLYSGESRIGNLALNFTDKTPAEYGLRTNARAQEALGLNANQNIEDALIAAGYPDRSILRADTRHELSLDLAAGPVKILPWVVGRGTVYDTDFENFAGDRDNSERLWGAAGLTVATTIQRIASDFYSRALDVNRVRHLVRPSATVFYAGSNVDQDELPVFDEDVESLADGAVMRLGLDQTWQTKRGGPGRWYSVDWITLDTELVFASDDAIAEDTIGRYFDSRPENSHLANFGTLSGSMQATESLTFAAATIYDFDESESSSSTAGFVLQHSPIFSSRLAYRYLNAQDSTLLSAGTDYLLSDKYSLSTDVTYDTDLGDIQSVRGELLRDFQNAVFGISFTYNNISEESSFGLLFQPLGRGSAARVGASPRSAAARGTDGLGS